MSIEAIVIVVAKGLLGTFETESRFICFDYFTILDDAFDASNEFISIVNTTARTSPFFS